VQSASAVSVYGKRRRNAMTGMGILNRKALEPGDGVIRLVRLSIELPIKHSLKKVPSRTERHNDAVEKPLSRKPNGYY